MDSSQINQIQFSLVVGNSILGTFSLIGCLIIISLFIFKSYLRDFIFKLTLCLAISEILNIIAYYMSIDFIENKILESNYCQLQVILITYSNSSSLLWILLICYSTHDLIINKNIEYDKRKNLYFFTGFLLPLIPTLL